MTTFFTESRKDRLIHERIHDPYKATCKPAEPSVCPVCNAVFKDGRWQWLESWPVDSHQVICQACQRIRDNYPAGLVTMSGDFIKTHKQEVLNLARQHEQGGVPSIRSIASSISKSTQTRWSSPPRTSICSSLGISKEEEHYRFGFAG